ncbi:MULTISPECIES: ABC transporter permease [Campylobacter]|uniref:ABC transporter permease subunit n=1 Tax=Campylobacter porcelli TaxID=1660073 RepID=A0A1X9SUR5_9BACT|nr:MULTISPECIES: ABC transporter permease subunit [unclassified Campylobacter]MCR8678837.1 ABC transporter permease subunit [Campylobacter sp. RM19072]MCR8695966.1 ABC transporter permease subunit [Campylobacter sp. RM19073]MEE3704862.1 ABC transporter permease subunit [Campylobacter sp. CX2-8023-23]MEE3744140.1 ABC transporter permease subunit [Campylobacter sp. CX2-4855-23]MEE3776885.1 ABC transporter permease subunit [Campylobacter sp. CX2-4080-23]
MITQDGNAIRLNAFHKISNYLIEGLSGLGIIALFLGVWHIGSKISGEFILPAPLNVLQRSLEIIASSDNQILLTIYRTTISIVFAFIIGWILGVIAGSFKTLARLFKPLMDIFLAIPPIIWIVISLFWFGIGSVSVIFSVFIAIFPLSFANSMLSVITLDDRLDEVCIAYKLNLFKRLKAYYLPHILPYLLNSLNIITAMGIKIMIMAELLGASDGVGAKIADARTYLDTTEVLAYVTIMIGFILLFNFLFIKPIKIIFLPWLKES